MRIEEIQLFEGLSNAVLTAYIQDSFIDAKPIIHRPAVVICPGGAFIGITEKEAEPVALRFLSAGYQAFVLRYSIGAGMARFPAPFMDAAKAMMIVRENADRWSINPDQISICGFSAGGQVAAFLAATWHEDYLAKVLHADNHLFKPNALVLGYPLLDLHQLETKSMERSLEMQPLLEMLFSAVYGTASPSVALVNEWNCMKRITSHMPSTFLWMTSEDDIADAETGLDFIKALLKNNIPYEFHVFEKGRHGLSLGNQSVGYSEADMKGCGSVHKWVDLALDWLAATFED